MPKKKAKPKKMKNKAYLRELEKLEVELVKLQGWIKQKVQDHIPDIHLKGVN